MCLQLYSIILCQHCISGRDVTVDTNINNCSTFCLFLSSFFGGEVTAHAITLYIRSLVIWYKHIILYLAYGTVLCMILFFQNLNSINKAQICSPCPSHAILNLKGMSVSKENQTNLWWVSFFIRQIEESFQKGKSLVFRQRWANLGT